MPRTRCLISRKVCACVPSTAPLTLAEQQRALVRVVYHPVYAIHESVTGKVSPRSVFWGVSRSMTHNSQAARPLTYRPSRVAYPRNIRVSLNEDISLLDVRSAETPTAPRSFIDGGHPRAVTKRRLSRRERKKCYEARPRGSFTEIAARYRSRHSRRASARQVLEFGFRSRDRSRARGYYAYTRPRTTDFPEEDSPRRSRRAAVGWVPWCVGF